MHDRYRSVPPEGAPPPAPLLWRAGSLLGAGTIASLLATIPAGMRVAPIAGEPLGAWLALAACALGPAVLAVAVLRSAREGARAFAGTEAVLAAGGVIAWALATFVALGAYGALLRATTHHHGLAGVTFAIGGVVIGLAMAIVVRRCVAIVRAASPRARAAGLGLVMIAGGAGLVVVGLRLARAATVQPPLPASMGAVLVDVLAFTIAVAFLSRGTFARAPWMARGGMPLALGVLVIGGALLARDPAIVAAIRERAPEFAPAAALAGGG